MFVETKAMSFPQTLSIPSAVSLWVVWNFEFFTINENTVMVRTVFFLPDSYFNHRVPGSAEESFVVEKT